MAKRPALGKGIGALIHSASRPVSAAETEGRKYFLCPIEELRPHDKQPRKSFDDARLAELAASIKEKGVIQPLVVRKQDNHFQIIAGERRWRAAQKAGLKDIPVVIQDVSEDWALEMALIENIQREDLNPIEEAEAYRNLMDSFDLSQEDVARRVGRERSTVANMLRLLRLPNGVRRDVISGQLSMGHARALLALDQDDDILEARDEVLKKQLSVRDCEALVKKIKSFGKAPPRAVVQPQSDPNLLHLEEALKRTLGTQARIVAKGRGGKIEISYYSGEELDRILELLGAI